MNAKRLNEVLEVFGLSITYCNKIEMRESLPRIYNKSYQFYEFAIKGIPEKFTLMESQKNNLRLSEEINKYTYIRNKTEVDNLILCFKEMNQQIKSQLISNRVPFINLSGDVSIPTLGLYLTQQENLQIAEPFNPSQQLIFLSAFYSKMKNNNNVEELAKSTGLSVSTIYRNKSVVEQSLVFENEYSKRDIWNRVENSLISPIIRKVMVSKKEMLLLEESLNLYESGENALSNYSSLARTNDKMTFAVEEKELIRVINRSNNELRLLFSNKHNEVLNVEDIMGVYVVIEVWSYIVKNKNTKFVDPLSLYLTLKDVNDERLQSALKEMVGREIGS